LKIYPKDLKSIFVRDVYTPIFIAALFITTKRWNRPQSPSTDELIKKILDTHTHTHTHSEIAFNLDKEGNSAIFCNMGGIREHYTK
jgi:hypothetical protein